MRIRNMWTGSLLVLGLLTAAIDEIFRAGFKQVPEGAGLCFIRGWLSVLFLPTPGSRVAGLFCISLPLLLLALLCPGSIGGGDVKLMGAAGLMLGWEMTVAAFLLGISLGGMYCLGLLVLGKAKRGDAIPFGPFLCVGLGTIPLFAVLYNFV